MAFRISNTLSDEDYRAMAEILSDRKALYGSTAVMHLKEEVNAVNMIRHSELELPLAHIGSQYGDDQIFTVDAETYEIKICVEYDSRENDFAKAVSALKGNAPEGYTMKSGSKTLEYFMKKKGYRVTGMGREIVFTTLGERRIGTETLKDDICSALQIIEMVVNKIYELAGIDVEIELRAGIKRSRAMRLMEGQNRSKMAIEFERPSLTFDEIGGCAEAKSELMLFAHGLRDPESFRRWGIRYPKGILLHGPPGTGKTLLARAMANLARASLYSVSIEDVMSCYYGESSKHISRVFKTAQSAAPSVILFDEIDGITGRRESSHEATGRMVSVFLQKMDGVNETKGITVIGTTNSVDRIDRALLRPGRFDKIIAVPVPDSEARSEIFRIHCAGKRIDRVLDYHELAAKSDGLTGADISEIIQMSLGKKLKEEVKTGNKDLGPLDTEDILESMERYMKGMALRSDFRVPKENTLMYM